MAIQFGNGSQRVAPVAQQVNRVAPDVAQHVALADRVAALEREITALRDLIALISPPGANAPKKSRAEYYREYRKRPKP